MGAHGGPHLKESKGVVPALDFCSLLPVSLPWLLKEHVSSTRLHTRDAGLDLTKAASETEAILYTHL